MTEAVFSDVGPRRLSSRSCAGGASMLSKTSTLLSALPEEDDAHVPVSGCDRRNLWHQNSFQFWSSHHDHMHCFARNHYCIILPTAPRRLAARDIDDAIRSDRKPFEKPTFALFWEWQQVNSTSASCFLPIRAKKQMLPGTRNETSFLGLFSDLAHGLPCIITEWLRPRSGRQLFWIILDSVYEECDVEHINVFGLVFYTRQLVFCSEFWILREMCTITDAQIFARCRMSKQQNHVFALASSAFFRASY